MTSEHIITFEKLRLVKAIITQLGVYYNTYISKNLIIATDLSKQQKIDADLKHNKLILLEI